MQKPTPEKIKTETIVSRFTEPFPFLFCAKDSTFKEFYVKSECTANKRIPPNFVLEKILEGELVPYKGAAPNDVYPVTFSQKSLVMDTRSDTVLPLDKFVKESYPNAKGIFSYQAWKKPGVGQFQGRLLKKLRTEQ